MRKVSALLSRHNIFFIISIILSQTVTAVGQLSPISGSQATFFVSPSGNDSNSGSEQAPFRTLDRARSAVRTINANMSGDIYIYLRNGRYYLSNSFLLDLRDSGTNGHKVIYSSYPGETASISGGTSITGWVPIGGGVYKAPFYGRAFRQLYVNNKRAIRARNPNVGNYYRDNLPYSG